MKKLLFAFALTGLLFSCKNSGKPTEEVAETSPLSDFAENYLKTGGDLRNTQSVADFLALSGTTFMPALVNDPMNFESYKGNKLKAAANIGVYMADGLYQVSLDKDYEGYMSVAAAKQLSIELGIEEVLDEILIDRYAISEHTADTILAVLKDALVKSETALTAKNEQEIFAAILVGNYIEKLYHLFANILEYPVDLPEESKMLILRDVLKVTQVELDMLPKAIALVEQYKKQDPAYLLEELKKLNEIHIASRISEEEAEKLTPAMVFENVQIRAMYTEIKNMRNYIVATE
ncbi:MAG: hypothetical protein IPM71_05830 [Bacteroidota bacterium]|nr:MAG: hypothetical protein IPM71_05830 [Bacteroidota bacterium]